jgi:hypothetical protein
MFKPLLIITILCLLLVPSIIIAAGLVPETCQDKRAEEQCGLPEIVKFFIIVANWILGILGSVALLYMMYGGFLILIGSKSGKKDETINHGKEALYNAITGVIIVLCSYVIIQFLIEKGFDGKFNAAAPAAPAKK